MNRLTYLDGDEEKMFWADHIPHIPFAPEWDVRAIPPYGGAVIRYYVRHKGLRVSIYLDGYDRLGSMGEPYWEMYPGPDVGQPERFLLAETDELAAKVAEYFASRQGTTP